MKRLFLCAGGIVLLGVLFWLSIGSNAGEYMEHQKWGPDLGRTF